MDTLVVRSAAELGITDQEHTALVWLQEALDPAIPDVNLPEWLVFDINSWGDLEGPNGACGTAFCLGGSMVLHMMGFAERGRPAPTWKDDVRFDNLSASYSPVLSDLFFNYRQGGRDRAAAAVGRFLSGNTSDPWLMGE